MPVSNGPTYIDEEVLYSFQLRELKNWQSGGIIKVLHVAKWDGHERPVAIYKISNGGKGNCDCIGSTRKPYCKHRWMIDHLLKAFPNTSFVGCFYDLDRDLLYHPDDGEGIPLTGVVDLKSALAIK